LSDDGGPELLAGSSATLTSLDKIHWTLSGLTSLTGATGTYTLTLSAMGIQDAAGNALATDVSRSFVVTAGVAQPSASVASADPSGFNSFQLSTVEKMARGTLVPISPLTVPSAVASFESPTSLSAVSLLERSRPKDISAAAAELEEKDTRAVSPLILGSVTSNEDSERLVNFERYHKAVDQLLATAEEDSLVDQLLESLATERRPAHSSIAR
jgi:hypothetical protein